MSPPPTRLQAVVLLRQALRDLLPHLPSQALRDHAGAALQATTYLPAELHPPVALPEPFGWAIRPAGKPGAPWGLETDEAHAEWCMAARDEAGRPHFEVVALAAMPAGCLPPLPGAAAQSRAASPLDNASPGSSAP